MKHFQMFVMRMGWSIILIVLAAVLFDLDADMILPLIGICMAFHGVLGATEKTIELFKGEI